MLTAIVGINWGDEGKGRMVDLLSERYNVVVRYQGGNNAGHTVINDSGKFILNLLPSGILRKDVVNVMGNGMVIDIEHLNKEIARLKEAGVEISPKNLKISEKAIICMPYHVAQDILEEERLGEGNYGSTRKGIAPVYSDKYLKKGIRAEDLFNLDKQKLRSLTEYKNITLAKAYNSDNFDDDVLYRWLYKNAQPLLPYICDVGDYLLEANKEGKDIMFEAQLGALRDIDFGIYPYTSSSSTIASYAPIGAGIPALKLTNVIGILKAYSTCVGQGPFCAEMAGEEAQKLREAGAEYGATTGRPRRVGGFDVVASKYGVSIQGADCLALTKLDILSYMEKIPVCKEYIINGEATKKFPSGQRLIDAMPKYEYLEGWAKDISQIRRKQDLPTNALKYIEYIQNAVDCQIKYVSVGPNRESYIEMY